MATVKKAQTGKNVPKGMVESEMFPGKMIPKSKSNYATGEYAKMLEAGRPKATATKAKATIKPKAKDGKWIQKAINPKHKGYCTPMTKATCTPRRKALAVTLKKMARARKGK